jgi:uncharacterized protein YjbI with pentapeptide repeats
MTNQKLSPSDDIFEQAKLAGLDPTEAFAGEDFSGRNLSRFDLSNFNLSGTNLNGANLSHAELNGAKLQDAQLRGVNLTEVKLCGANLSDADLNGADLRRANLSGAILCRAKLSNANLSDTNLSGTDVRDAFFGGSLGLAEDTKRNLKNRGAVFADSTAQRNSLLGKDMKWWLQFVIVPLIITSIGSGGIVSIINALKREATSPIPVPNIMPTTQVTPPTPQVPGIYTP